MSDGMAHDWASWPPEASVFAVPALDLAVMPGPHPLLVANRDAIAANWEREQAANPALFDGQMVLQHRLRLAQGRLAGQGYLAPFSAFLWWRRQSLPTGALHLAAMPVIETGDGAVIAVRMAAHTANAGRVYFAAGSLDADDIVDGRCDVAFNMRREVLEETGIDLRDAAHAGEIHAFRMGQVVTLFRRYRFTQAADELLARIEAFIASEAEPEIETAVAIRTADPSAHHYQSFMPVILRHVL